jgi:cytochrome oxidase assembly protein ShyY1
MDVAITPVLFSVTFILAIAFGIWQYRRAMTARREHHRSAAAKANNEPRATENSRA